MNEKDAREAANTVDGVFAIAMALNRVAEAIETSRSPQRKKPGGLGRRRQYTPEEDAIIQQDFAAELPGWRDPRAQALSRSGCSMACLCPTFREELLAASRRDS